MIIKGSVQAGDFIKLKSEDGTLIEDQILMASHFKNSFTNDGTNLTKTCCSRIITLNITENNLILENVTFDFICGNLIDSFSKKKLLDEMHPNESFKGKQF